ncbi:hypothetical protein [Streptomyces sp. NPDC050504]|uniref:hypothetical protein n=1 Tax=Streptomyces sp. NPDC050504 TaxID=3365618 RepID=UPI00378A01A7
MSDHEHPSEKPPEHVHHSTARPTARVFAAAAVAVASLATAVVILFLTPGDSGLAAAGAVATAGLALAGQLSGPSR